jgi:hypothetical protein
VYKIALVLRSTGAVYLIKGGAFTNWTIYWVSQVGTTATLYPVRTGFLGAFKHDDFAIATLPAPFATDYGLVTDYKASPSANDTITQAADGIVKFTWTAVTGQTLNFMVRYTDDSNCWIVRGDQGGSTIKLIEMNAGVETERASAAQTWTNGSAYTISAFCLGNTIKTYVETTDVTLKNNYASASFNNTATGVKVDKAGSNLASWNKTVSGTPASILSTINP